MKKILLTILVLILCSCSDDAIEVGKISNGNISIRVIDSCEYVYYHDVELAHNSREYVYYHNVGLAHKGNCKYCKQRMIDLLKQSKDTLK